VHVVRARSEQLDPARLTRAVHPGATMKPPCPQILRKGAVVRVAEDGLMARALVSVDLRFDDGRVERWMGPGQEREGDEIPKSGEGLVRWGEEVCETNATDLLEELAMDFDGVSHRAMDAAPVEVVVAWNHAFGPREYRDGPSG